MKSKLIRGRDWKQLEQLTDDLFENMDKESRDRLDEAVKPYREQGYNTVVYDEHLITYDCGGYVSSIR